MTDSSDPGLRDPGAKKKKPPKGSDTVTLTIDAKTKYQTIEGFGAAIVYDTYRLTDNPKKDEINQLLFGDLGLSILRMGNYYDLLQSADTEYNQTPPAALYSPYSTMHEHYAHALSASTALGAAAKSINPDLKLLLCAWTPPARFKSNKKVLAGSMGADFTGYGTWWNNSLNYYKTKINANIDYISIQNEPNMSPIYEGCNMTAAQYKSALDAVSGAITASRPLFLGPDTEGFTDSESYLTGLGASKGKLYAYCHHMYTDVSGSTNIDKFDDPSAYATPMKNYKSWIGDNWNGTHNNIPIEFMTEFARPGQANESADQFYTDAINEALHIHNYLTAEQGNAYVHWSAFRNEVTDKDQRGETGLIQGGLITLTNNNTNYKINDWYYAMEHYSSYIKPGFQRVSVTNSNSTSDLSAVAFQGPGELIIVIINSSSTNRYKLNYPNIPNHDLPEIWAYQTTNMKNGRFQFRPAYFMNPLTLPARSITTYVVYGFN